MKIPDERNQKTTFTAKNLSCLWKTLYLAQKMGKELGRSNLLL